MNYSEIQRIKFGFDRNLSIHKVTSFRFFFYVVIAPNTWVCIYSHLRFCASNVQWSVYFLRNTNFIALSHYMGQPTLTLQLRGSVLAFDTQVRGFKPGRSRRIFQSEKILSTPSFGGEVKPSIPCRRFTACKRFLNATRKSGISGKIHRPFLAHIVPPLATRISGETTSGESWNV